MDHYQMDGHPSDQDRSRSALPPEQARSQSQDGDTGSGPVGTASKRPGGTAVARSESAAAWWPASRASRHVPEPIPRLSDRQANVA